MRKLAIFALVCLSACSDSGRTPSIDQTLSREQAVLAQREAEAIAQRDISVRFVCGASAGRGYFLDDAGGNWVEDGITDGRLVFVTDANGANPNVYFRDTGGRYISARDGGGEISVVQIAGGSVWMISYPSTGVVETHNIANSDGRILDLWSANKPHTALGGPRVQAFTAYCVTP